MSQTANTGTTPTKPRRLILRTVLLVLLAVIVAWRAWPLIDPHSEQDQCTFGTGSTELYQSLRAEANDYLAKNGRVPLRSYSSMSAQEFADGVSSQLRIFAMTRETPSERWAAMHALLRAYGMEFDSSGPRDKVKLKSEFVVLSARYFIQLPKLNWFCLFCYVFPTSAFVFQIDNRGDGVYDRLTTALYIRPLNTAITSVYLQRFDWICPPVLK